MWGGAPPAKAVAERTCESLCQRRLLIPFLRYSPIVQPELTCQIESRDPQSHTSRSMPETKWMARSIRFVEHEFAPFEGHGLGLIESLDSRG